MKRNKIFIATISLLLVFVLIPLAFGAGKPEKQIILKAAGFLKGGAHDGLAVDATEWFCKQLEKKTHGLVKTQFYWSGSLVKMRETLKAGKTGLADIIQSGEAIHPSDLPIGSFAAEIGRAPTGCDGLARALQETYNTYAPYREQFERKNNIKVLYFSFMPPIVVGTKMPLTSLDRFKGLRLRVIGYGAKIFGNLGATTINIPVPDIYLSMERGTIDGWTWTYLGSCIKNSLHEVTPYILDPGWGQYGHNWFAINMDTYNSFPKKVKKIIDEDLNHEVIRQEMIKRAHEYEEKVLWPKVKKSNLKMIILPPEESKKWLAATRHDQNIAKRIANLEAGGHRAQGWYDTYSALIDKYVPEGKYVPIQYKMRK